MDPIKVAGVAEWPVPKTKKEVQSFLWFATSIIGSLRVLISCMTTV